jgi:hypothetical protein
MFTYQFWQLAIKRAVKTFAQNLLASTPARWRCGSSIESYTNRLLIEHLCRKGDP